MESFIKFLVGGLLGGALVLGVSGLFTKPVEAPPSGATASPDVFSFTHFYDNVSIGGKDLATTSQGTVTYTAASFVGSRVIEHIASAATTGTLPTNAALSAAGFLPVVGDTQTIFIHASTTAITLAGNTGVTLHSSSSTLKVAAGSIGRLECTRLGALEGRGIWCLLSAD